VCCVVRSECFLKFEDICKIESHNVCAKLEIELWSFSDANDPAECSSTVHFVVMCPRRPNFSQFTQYLYYLYRKCFQDPEARYKSRRRAIVLQLYAKKRGVGEKYSVYENDIQQSQRQQVRHFHFYCTAPL